MITHYGLFWSESDVFWGRPKRAGQLLGRAKTPLGRRGAPTKNERDKSSDYRDFVGLYCLYGDGELLYVGEAGLSKGSTLFKRLKDHRKDSLAGRWDSFSWFGRKKSKGQCNVALALAQLEAAAIAMINPGFNKQSGTFGNAMQVFQVPHEYADGDVTTKLERLLALVGSTKKSNAKF